MSRTKTNQLHRLDIRRYSYSELEGAKVVELTLNNYTQKIKVTTTPCNYGKVRHWFVCPYCSGRCAIIYQANSGLACRKCYKLCYASENKTKSDRAIDGAVKLNRRLGFTGDIYCYGKKPKGMHWKTFRKLVAKRNDYSTSFWNGVGLWMGRRFKLN